MALKPDVMERLIKAAREASKRSHCPHTKFAAGAAVLTDDGQIFAGCRIENAAAGLTMCACRNAIFRAVSEGHTEIEAVLVYIPGRVVKAPCGSCRQVINEFGPTAEVYSICDGPEVLHRRLSDLLPEAFGPELP
jgi:cytidine deaminase